MTLAFKLIPHLACWAALAVVLLRAFPARRTAVAGTGGAGFLAGVCGVYLLSRSLPSELTFAAVRDLVGGSLLLLWGVGVASLYASGARREQAPTRAPRAWLPLLCAALAGAAAGAVSACRLISAGSPVSFLALMAAGGGLALLALFLERWLIEALPVTGAGLAASVSALLLFSASSLPRLDLFAPLTMKVMKFAHDFVHQFFESMLIPDHLFIRPYLWGYIGLLFGKGVGFWGALLIWLTPVFLVLLAVSLTRLPSVSHIRQGAQRRRLLAAALRARRLRLVVPCCALLLLGGAVYRSSNPTVEYWDPKPLPVSATAAGTIFIPKKGEVELEDGKLHKYLYRRGEQEARFFVLMTPAGKLTVALDACSICKPEGYGQSDDTVICYYCKTLIPLDTVGSVGGCNPVPVPFQERTDGVVLDSNALINTWTNTVQATSRGKGGGA